MRRTAALIFILFTLVFAIPNTAQDALNLPTELFVLLNGGEVQRYGLGTEGVSTVTPEGQFVVDFGVSPDGGWLAYRTVDALVVRAVMSETGEVLRVTPPLPPSRGEGSTLAWSPDAGALAYTTENGFAVYFRLPEPPATPTTVEITDGFADGGFEALRWSVDGRFLAARSIVDDIWQVYSVGNAALALEAVVTPATDVAWLPDGRLAVAPLDGGLIGLNVAVGNAQGVILPADRRYDVLGTRADGTLLAFSRPLESNAGNTGRLTDINVAAGTFEILGVADVELDGLRWTPGAQLAAAFRGGVLVLIDPVTGNGFQLPISSAVAYDWGAAPPPLVDGYPVPANLFFVAADEAGIAQVWQVFRNGSAPGPLTAAASDVRGYAISPDGFGVAYATDDALWLQRLNDGSEAVMVAEREAEGPTQIDFSADGSTLAYRGPDGIRTVSLAGGEASLLIADTLDTASAGDGRVFSVPRYAPNVGAMLLDVTYAEGGATGVLDLNSGELLELPFGYRNGGWTYDGDILTFAEPGPFSQAGVQRTVLPDVENPTVVLPPDLPVVDAVLIPQRRREDFRVLLGTEGAGPTPLRVFDFRDGAGLVPVLDGGFIAHPRLSPDGTVVVGYTRAGVGADGLPAGRLALVDVATGNLVALRAPDSVSQVRWQR
jgi:Tol biopolymer transport system component